MSDAPETVYVDFDGFGTPESIWVGGDVMGSVIYIRKNLHDAALACIAELGAERDAAYAAGYRAALLAAKALLDIEAEQIGAQVEAAFCEGYYMGKDGAWDSYSRAWPHSDALAALQKKGGAFGHYFYDSEGEKE